MPYRDLPDGLYLLQQKSSGKGVDHYGILDIGNRLRISHPLINGYTPVVVHQTPPSITVQWLEDTAGDWNLRGRIMDEAMAIERMAIAHRTPNYNVFGNNCEHFARFVATGKRESKQLQAAGTILGLAVLALVVLNDE